MIFTSIFGIVTLVLLARALGFDRNPVLDEAVARGQVEAALPGFAAAAATIDPSGRTAIVTAHDGRVACIAPHGDRWVVRVQPA